MYESTRGNLNGQTASQAITLGMVPSGGLFVPSTFPNLNWQDLQGLTYRDVAKQVMMPYLADFPEEAVSSIVDVYRDGTFDGEDPAPLVSVGKFGVLELWHGPTAAFKDMALQVLPDLLKVSLKQFNRDEDVLILVATSGDTGKAALEGFKNRKGMHIVVFYPDGGVSPVQERQMTTTEGSNTHVVAVKGNFDQCQTAVKQIFASESLKRRLQEKNLIFSSANSINWGRLLPQIVYYYWAYLQAVKQGKVAAGSAMNVVVPTGNFGNLQAAYYAKCMGLPLDKIICASNTNNVLTDFFATGVYQSQRTFYQTISPSMDILVSSNFERFLYEMSGRDAEKVRSWYDASNQGMFSVDDATLKACRNTVYAGWANEEETLETIAKSYQAYNYVFDPHTAVAMKVYDDYVSATKDQTFTAIASTASPFKFSSNVIRGLDQRESCADEWEALNRLSMLTGWKIPAGLQGLEKKPEKRVHSAIPEEIAQLVQIMFG
ncbi:threonine synthase [Desulfosporosinus orientis DSM 765]|uniref:Threonine synthase n=1 Tax=Desulfosporosinus orientis (strain ATCC 19365 / DSM 765 / NCIMB 8382 / VKM B-1628 / Singapore I) TaxID=768706 RepID=G7WFN4_DESOD|nr:threonine synthase [Desulfosporosinus orientis]AET68907.1 threonine synthase [Desulfosporosinus orientis DSM 765]